MNDLAAQELFREFTGKDAQSFTQIPQSGSARANYIASDSDGQKFVVTFNKNLRENRAFLYFSELFSELKLNTPKILKVSEDGRAYIQEFLGEKTLSEIITENGLNARVRQLIKQVLGQLYRLQISTQGKVDLSQTFEYVQYGSLAVQHDLNYFKFMFADVLGLSYHKSALLKEFQQLAALVEKFTPKVLMIRDFQARNILVNSRSETFFIDYQSAMQGPAMYDAVSLLYQAKAHFPDDFKEEMLAYFISFFPAEQAQLKLSVKPILLLRYLQVLGAYGFRGLVQRKPHFTASIPQGVTNLTVLAKNWDALAGFPELKNLILQLEEDGIQQQLQHLIHS